jgi:uncharacterized membrane protein YebE (DUF533 family)
MNKIQNMNKKKLALIIGSAVAVAILGYLGYNMYKKSQTSSQDPEKNNRNVVQELLDI